MKIAIVVFVILLGWVAASEAQTRCTYRCSGRVCWVECG